MLNDHFLPVWRSGREPLVIGSTPIDEDRRSGPERLYASEEYNYYDVIEKINSGFATVAGGSGTHGKKAWLLSLQRLELQSAHFKNLPITEPSLAILPDAYYPGWKVFVDGKERKIIRTNWGMRGVKVKLGDQVVEFLYQPWSFRVGLWLCLISLASAAVAGVRKRRKR